MHSRQKRRRTEINYARLNEGLLEVSQTHPHVAFFQTHNPIDTEIEPNIDRFFVKPYSDPLPIPQQWFHKLNMRIDKDMFTPRSIAFVLGEDKAVPVMDSVTQQGVKKWTLGKWRDYLEMDPRDRRTLTKHGTLNLISLEFSGTKLATGVSRPKLVEQHDLVDQIWPEELAHEKPKVRLYSLTSAAQSFTDFHLDFAGTSVFYHVVFGKKSFMFVRPTSSNLKAYEKWCNSSDQQITWFPSILKRTQSSADNVFQVDIGPGDSLLIPSGWIHAVYTPEDSSVVGGNFLTQKDMPMQIKIDGIEQATKVPKQFRFPHFDRVLYYYNMFKKGNEETTSEEAIKEETNKEEMIKEETIKEEMIKGEMIKEEKDSVVETTKTTKEETTESKPPKNIPTENE